MYNSWKTKWNYNKFAVFPWTVFGQWTDENRRK